MAMESENSAVDQVLLSKLKARVDGLYLEYVFPVLATLRLGEDPAAVAAEAELLAAARAAGVIVRRYIMPEDLSLEDVDRLIRQINADPQLSALLVWRPLPAHLDAETVYGLITPAKALREGPACEVLTRVIDAAERSAQ